jgi:hypothetical protein
MSKVLAQFPKTSADTLIPLYQIERAVDRDIPAGSPIELGVDVARFGSDETVIMVRRGNRSHILKTLPMSDTMETAGAVIIAMRETGATLAKIDSVGIGAGVYDRLKEQKIPVIEMQSGASAKDKERFANSRAEWWWTLRDRFEQGTIAIDNDDTLISQLSSVKYKVNSKGQILIESKDEAKRRGVKSPDRADALMMLFAHGTTVRNPANEPTVDQCICEEAPQDDFGLGSGDLKGLFDDEEQRGGPLPEGTKVPGMFH